MQLYREKVMFAHERTRAEMLQGANREVQRCVEGNGVLSFEAHCVVHSQYAFSFSLSLSFSSSVSVERRCHEWKSDAHRMQLRSTRGIP